MMTKDEFLKQLKLTANHIHDISEVILQQSGLEDVAERLESESLILDLIVEEIQAKGWLQ